MAFVWMRWVDAPAHGVGVLLRQHTSGCPVGRRYHGKMAQGKHDFVRSHPLHHLPSSTNPPLSSTSLSHFSSLSVCLTTRSTCSSSTHLFAHLALFVLVSPEKPRYPRFAFPISRHATPQAPTHHIIKVASYCCPVHPVVPPVGPQFLLVVSRQPLLVADLTLACLALACLASPSTPDYPHDHSAAHDQV